MVPTALERALADATPELLAAARRELPRHLAEDAVQDTFTTAVVRGATFDARRGTVGAWLRTLLRGSVRDLRRRERRRATLPLEEPSSAVGDATPVDAAIQRELVARVRREIAALPPDYRAAVELHVEHGLSAATVASRLAIAPGTARSRIARGLEHLRQRLPHAVLILVLPQSLPPTAPTPPLAPLPGRGAATLAVATLCIAVGSWWHSTRTGAPPAEPTAERTAEPQAAPANTAISPDADPVGAAAQHTTPADNRERLGSRTRPIARVVYARSGAPAASVEVVVSAAEHALQFPTTDPAGLAHGLPWLTNTDARGEIQAPEAARGTWNLRVRRAPAWTSIVVDGGTDHSAARIAIPPGCSLVGRVVGPGAEPIAGARVFLRAVQCWPADPDENDALPGELIAVTDGAGQFAVEDIAAGRRLAVWAQTDTTISDVTLGSATVGERLAVELVAATPTLPVTGTLHARDGRELPRAEVVMTDASRRTLATRTDAHGRFVLPTVAGVAWLRGTRLDADGAWAGARHVVIGAAGLRDEALELAPSSRLEVSAEGTEFELAAAAQLPSPANPTGELTVLRAHGRVALVGMPPGLYAVRVRHRPTRWIGVSAGTTTRVVVAPDDAAVGPRAMQLQTAEGTPLIGWRLAAGDAITAVDTAASDAATFVTDAAGRTSCAADTRWVRVFAPTPPEQLVGLEHRQPPLATLALPPPGAAELALRLAPTQWPPATLHLPLHDDWRGEVVLLDESGAPRFRRVVATAASTATFTVVPPGIWQPALRRDRGPWRFLAARSLRAGDSVTSAAHEDPGTGTLRLIWHESVSVTQRAAAQLAVRSEGQLLPIDDEWRRTNQLTLCAGAHELLMLAPGGAPQRYPCRIAPGTEFALRLSPIEAGVSTTLWISTTPHADVMPATLVISRNQVVVWHERRRFAPAEPFPWPVTLAPGPHEIELRGGSAGPVHATVDVTRPESLFGK